MVGDGAPCVSTERKDILTRYFMTIRLQKSEELKGLLQSDHSIVDSISRDGFNGLQLAAKYGFGDIADILVEHKINANGVDGKYKRTFLHWAAINGHSSIVSGFMRGHPVLLTSVLDSTDSTGYSALMHAVKGGRVEVTRLLLSVGARTDISVGTGASAKTAFDLCNKSTELLSMLKQAQNERSGNTDTKPPLTPVFASVERKEFEWGLSSRTHSTKHAQTRKKCIENGWVKRSQRLSPTSGIYRCSMAQVVVKLNRDERELLLELTNRSLVNTVYPTANTCKTTNSVTETATAVAATETFTATVPDDTNPHFVQCLHPSLITVSDKGGIWHGIVLEKGLTDLHHLYDFMHQRATHSRLADLRWKLDVISKMCRVCSELSRRNLVWYDLKPSNFILFPKDKGKLDVRDVARYNAALHQWLQNSEWDSVTFLLKAADLSSVYGANSGVQKVHISCTAKYLHPAVASMMSQEDSHTVVTDVAHMRWSFGMSALQLLHCENKPLFAHYDLTTSEQVYAFLKQDCAHVQSKVNEYIEWLVMHHCSDTTEEVRGAIGALLSNVLTMTGNVTYEEIHTELARIMSLLT